MEKKCQNCGFVLPEGALFCPECGTKFTPAAPEAGEEVKPADNVHADEKTNEPKEQTGTPDPGTAAADNQSPVEAEQEKSAEQIAAAAVPEKTEKNPDKASKASEDAEKAWPCVKTGFYFWMLLVYSIPVIGFIINIITASSLKNPSKRHFAAAVLAWTLIAIAAGLLISIASVIIIGIVVSGSGTPISGLSDILDLITKLSGGLITFN